MPTQHDGYLPEVSKHLARVPRNVPAHRKAASHTYSFSDGSFEEQLVVWDHIWNNTRGFWVRVHATFFLERHLKKDEHLIAMWPVIVRWQDSIDDWGLCDSLAKVYTKVLVVSPEKVYRVLKRWNKDVDLWKRRQSKEYYVQKGVGWALRELRNVYPREAHAYLTKHIRVVSPIAFTIAIEKVSEAERETLKTLRKR